MSIMALFPAMLRFAGWLLIPLAAVMYLTATRKLKQQTAENRLISAQNDHYQTELLRIRKELALLSVELKTNARKKEMLRQHQDDRIRALQQALKDDNCANQPVPAGVIRLQRGE